MESLQQLTYDYVFDRYNPKIVEHILPSMVKQMREEIINSITEIACKRLRILDTEGLIYGPRINKEYKSDELFDYNFNEYPNYTREELQNIVDNITHVTCRIPRKPLPLRTTQLVLSDINEDLDISDTVKHIGLLHFNAVKSLPSELLSLKVMTLLTEDEIARFHNLQSLECSLINIECLTRFQNLQRLDLNIDDTILNGELSIDVSPLITLQHLELYSQYNGYNRITVFNIIGLDLLNLKYLSLRSLGLICMYVNAPYTVICESLALDFVCIEHTLSISGLIFLSPEELLASGYSSYLKHLKFKGSYDLFHEASRYVTSLELLDNNVSDLRHLTRLKYLNVTTNHVIYPPSQLKAIKLSVSEDYKHNIFINLSECQQLLGIDANSKYIKLQNVPLSVRWIFEKDNLDSDQFNRLLKQIIIIYVRNALSIEELLDNPHIKIIIFKKGDYTDCEIEGDILKLSEFSAILIRDLPPGYIIRNMRELYKYIRK